MLRLTSACAAAFFAFCATAVASEPAHAPELDDMIARQAKRHGVPEKLVRRIVMRESRYNPKARNHSFWGLMQISYPTARSMGFKGSPSELLDPVVNLTYAVPYLANAFIIAGRQEDAAVRLYASGYYATAKNRNLLSQLRTAESTPLGPDEGFLTATARPVSNLITAVVGGPAAQQPQQVAAAAPDGPAETGGKNSGPEVAMISGKKGYTPPPKWIKDGGVSLVARGEQRAEQVAAHNTASESGTASRRSAARGGSRKNTEFAALDAPPSSAQAYAPTASAADGGPQAAIAQATAAQSTGAPATEAADAATVDPKRTKGQAAGHRRKAAIAAAADDAAAPADPSADAAPVLAKKQPGRTHVVAKKPSRAVSAAAKADAPAAQAAQ